jgi:hypothetical protein
MSVSETNIPAPATKSMHIEVNLSDNISPKEIDILVNINFTPILPLSKILEQCSKNFKVSNFFQSNSDKFVRKMRDKED